MKNYTIILIPLSRYVYKYTIIHVTMKMTRLEDDVWLKLSQIKLDNGDKTISNVIKQLINAQEVN